MQLIIWKYLVFLRFLLVCIPQTGYIHPDEYFQSIEVLSGDILGLDTHRAWEFNISCNDYQKPIRSIVLPYLTVGFPLLLLKKISYITQYTCGFGLLSPYLLLVLPRLLMTTFSLIADMCLSQICRLYKKNHVECVCVYASSYVVFVYFTRTLSNSIETVLYACMLSTVAKSMHATDKILLKRNTTNLKDGDLGTPFCHRIALLLTVGVFNRPTFAAFAITPVMFWIFYGYSIKPKHCKQYAVRVISLFPGVMLSGIFLTLCDTSYYQCEPITQYFSFDSLLHMKWIVTPVNNFLYNSKKDNLVLHGLHPQYTHLLVNMPLLFNVLGIIGIMGHIKMIFAHLQKQREVECVLHNVMVCCYIVPVLILSIAPHQEPRFIIGVLLPLVFVHGNKLTAAPHTTATRFLQTLWVMGNVVCCLFFGFLHQGGVIPSLIRLHTLKHASTIQNADVIFYHTYMPPRFLLLNQRDDAPERPIRIHDLMGGSLIALYDKIQSVQCSPSIVVISPASLRDVIVSTLDNSHSFQLISTYTWHLSMEDPPPVSTAFFDSWGLDTFSVKSISDNCTSHSCPNCFVRAPQV